MYAYVCYSIVSNKQNLQQEKQRESEIERRIKEEKYKTNR